MSFAATSIRNLFPTPFIVASFDDDKASQLNSQLIKLILEREQKTAGVSVSNVGGWQSDTGILEWGGLHVKAIVDSMLKLLDSITLRIVNGQYMPHPGDCVLFPSWLQHAVTRYAGNGTRISLAFNFSVNG